MAELKEYIIRSSYTTSEGKTYKSGEKVKIKKALFKSFPNSFIDPSHKAPIDYGFLLKENRNLKEVVKELNSEVKRLSLGRKAK